MRDPELVARAGYAAARLEQAWERWRALHGLGGSADPLASYVGYSLKEPMGQPRVVIGVDAAEAEFFADFLESHDCSGLGADSGLAADAGALTGAGLTAGDPRPVNGAMHSPGSGPMHPPVSGPMHPPVGSPLHPQGSGPMHPPVSGPMHPPVSGPQRVLANGAPRPSGPAVRLRVSWYRCGHRFGTTQQRSRDRSGRLRRRSGRRRGCAGLRPGGYPGVPEPGTRSGSVAAGRAVGADGPAAGRDRSRYPARPAVRPGRGRASGRRTVVGRRSGHPGLPGDHGGPAGEPWGSRRTAVSRTSQPRRTHRARRTATRNTLITCGALVAWARRSIPRRGNRCPARRRHRTLWRPSWPAGRRASCRVRPRSNWPAGSRAIRGAGGCAGRARPAEPPLHRVPVSPVQPRCRPRATAGMGKCLTATNGAGDSLGSVLRGSTAWPQPGVRYGGQINNQEGKLSSPQDVWARHGQAPGRAQTPGNLSPPPAPLGCSRGLSEPPREPTKPQVNFWVFGALAVRFGRWLP